MPDKRAARRRPERRKVNKTSSSRELRGTTRKAELALVAALFVVVLLLGFVLIADVARTQEALTPYGLPEAGLGVYGTSGRS